MKGGGRIIHYTCNAPKEEVLLKNGIYPVGKRFGCANNTEVVIMTRHTIEKAIGRTISEDQSGLVIDCENTLRNIGRQN